MIAVIGDPHGCLLTLKALITQVRMDHPGILICIVGDLIDRGPLSAQVIQFVIDENIYCVLGNHEQMMIDETHENGQSAMKMSGIWGPNGGFQTFKSYHVEPKEDEENSWPALGINPDFKLVAKHREWLLKLPLYLEFEDLKDDQDRHLLVTHSSAHPCWKWTKQQRKENYSSFKNHLIWGRMKNYKPIDGIYNIFGHSPYPTFVKEEVKVKSFYANVDTGAVFKGSANEGYGLMTALVFPQMEVYQQENVDKSEY